MSEMDLQQSPPIMYDDQMIGSHHTSLDSIDDNFDFDLNVDENHFSLSANVPTILVVNLENKFFFLNIDEMLEKSLNTSSLKLLPLTM